jgi:hypothetical protein
MDIQASGVMVTVGDRETEGISSGCRVCVGEVVASGIKVLVTVAVNGMAVPLPQATRKIKQRKNKKEMLHGQLC